ncbi:unnamed protein product [Clavelina lepadiformis]|uniref:Nucleolar complex protein 2 homolog n=1 Tax=Clavelina lepadiformis TaxID=159417 RepID=A0ABP0GWW2_CLALP
MAKIEEMSVDEFMEKDWGDTSSNEENMDKDDPPRKMGKKKFSKKKEKFPPNAHEKNKDPLTDHEQKTINPESCQAKKISKHQKQLDGLKERDPAFYKFLQEEDSTLLNFKIDDLDASSDESDNEIHKFPETLDEASDSDVDVGDSSDNEKSFDDQDEPFKKKEKHLLTVSEQMIKSWQSRLTAKEPSLTALKQLMQAFQAALARIDAQEKEQKTSKGKKRKKSTGPTSKYKIIGAATFNAVVRLCIQCVPPSLASILNYSPDNMKHTKKKKIPLPSSCQRWNSVRDDVRAYLTNAVTLAQSLFEPSVTRVFLRHLLILLPYFISFPKIAKVLSKMLIKFWSSADNESVRVLSFLCITRLLKLDKDRFLENVMKQCYLSYVSNCKFTSPTTLPMINFMQRTFAEICAIDTDLTYRFAFLYIRQLAVHLRKAITTKNKETRQAVYNWQYVHSLALWCRVLSVLHPNDILHPLIYPLVQVSLGVIDLVPTARYYPLRFRITENLVALGDCTNTYIPLLSFITSPLRLAEFKKQQTGVAIRSLSFDTILRLSNSQLKEKSYRDGTIDRVYDLLMAYFNSQAHTVAFPEMSIPTIVMLKKFVKECKTPNYSKVIKQIVEKVQENSEFIQRKRSDITFDIKDISAMAAWESNLKESGVPFHTKYSEYRKNRQRELVQQIADKDRNVEEKLPSIDRAKFLEKSKADDKLEFNKLFEGDIEEDFEADFEKAVNDGGFKKKQINSSEPAEASADEQSNNEDGDDDQQEQEVQKKDEPRKRKIDLASGYKDIVKDFSFSDSDGDE